MRAQVLCASSSTKDTNCTSFDSSGDCCTGAVEPAGTCCCPPPPPWKNEKKFFPVSRLRTRRMIAPPQPIVGPRPNPNPPPLPRRSSMSEETPPGVHRMWRIGAYLAPELGRGGRRAERRGAERRGQCAFAQGAVRICSRAVRICAEGSAHLRKGCA